MVGQSRVSHAITKEQGDSGCEGLSPQALPSVKSIGLLGKDMEQERIHNMLTYHVGFLTHNTLHVPTQPDVGWHIVRDEVRNVNVACKFVCCVIMFNYVRKIDA